MTVHDLRQSPRRRTLLPAHIEFADRKSVLDCTVRELSREGARLEIPSTFGVPDRFVLHIPGLRVKLPCRIAWSNMREMGIAFCELPAQDLSQAKVVAQG